MVKPLEKVIRVFSLLLCLEIFLGGYSMAVELVSVEQFLEKAGLSMDSLENRDLIQQFIVDRDLDEYIFAEIPAFVLARYANCIVLHEPISYDDLLEMEPTEPTDLSDFNDLEQVAIVIANDASIKSLVVDFNVGKAYFSPAGSVVEDVCYADKVIKIDDDLQKQIRQLFTETEFPINEYKYVGDTSYRNYVVLAFKANDVVVRYTAAGIDNGMPRDIMDLCYGLIDLINKKAA